MCPDCFLSLALLCFFLSGYFVVLKPQVPPFKARCHHLPILLSFVQFIDESRLTPKVTLFVLPHKATINLMYFPLIIRGKTAHIVDLQAYILIDINSVALQISFHSLFSCTIGFYNPFMQLGIHQIQCFQLLRPQV